jgi:hypothetical protein
MSATLALAILCAVDERPYAMASDPERIASPDFRCRLRRRAQAAISRLEELFSL